MTEGTAFHKYPQYHRELVPARRPTTSRMEFSPYSVSNSMGVNVEGDGGLEQEAHSKCKHLLIEQCQSVQRAPTLLPTSTPSMSRSTTSGLNNAWVATLEPTERLLILNRANATLSLTPTWSTTIWLFYWTLYCLRGAYTDIYCTTAAQSLGNLWEGQMTTRRATLSLVSKR